jgi:hypothetical protein
MDVVRLYTPTSGQSWAMDLGVALDKYTMLDTYTLLHVLATHLGATCS